MRYSPKILKSGFTLVELLVVIAIITLLYTVVFGSVSNSKAKARDDKRISDVKQIQLAIAQFYDSCQDYPSSIGSSVSCPSDATIIFGDFLKQIPTDPSGGGYSYVYVASPRSFCLGANLEVNDPSNRTDNATCYVGCPSGLCFSVKGP